VKCDCDDKGAEVGGECFSVPLHEGKRVKGMARELKATSI
jgi:hypothetical protein